VEGLLNGLLDMAVTHLQPGYLYTNLYGFVGLIKGQGLMGANYGGDDKLVLVSPTDVAAAAKELTTPAAAAQPVRYVASDELTATEAARILKYAGWFMCKKSLTTGLLPDCQHLTTCRNNHVLSQGAYQSATAQWRR
jgi:hypothetical protein